MENLIKNRYADDFFQDLYYYKWESGRGAISFKEYRASGQILILDENKNIIYVLKSLDSVAITESLINLCVTSFDDVVMTIVLYERLGTIYE